MKLAGWQGRPQWGEGAFDAIFKHTDGIPRRINRLCSRALMHGALDEHEVITADMIESTAHELAEDLRGGEPEGDAGGPVMSYAQQTNSGAPLDLSGIDLSATDQRLLGHLAARLSALEGKVAQREQMFQRLAALFSGQ